MKMTREESAIFEAALKAARQQLNSAELDFVRVTHNVDAVIQNVQKIINELPEGGEAVND